MKINPLGDRVLVEREVENLQTASGIWKPEIAEKYTLGGAVVAVGPDVKKIEVGTKVLLGAYPSTHVSPTHYLIHENEILAVLTEPE